MSAQHRQFSSVFMSRRHAVKFAVVAGISPLTGASGAQAQVSQRARQLKERRDCELGLPDCRPDIQAQLKAEQQRLQRGLGGLGIASALIAGWLWWRKR